MDAPLLRTAGTTAPNNVRNVYWSSRGVMPGKRGNAYLLGHTYDSKPSGVGVLDHLKRLRKGKLIVIDKGSKNLRFKVTRTEHLALHPSEKKMAELFSHLGHARMTVVTCLWSNSQDRYVKLLVKHARKIS